MHAASQLVGRGAQETMALPRPLPSRVLRQGRSLSLKFAVCSGADSLGALDWRPAAA